jgi:hypothetical protein
MTADEIRPILKKAHENYDSGRMSDALILLDRVLCLMDRNKIEAIGPYNRASIAQSQAMARCGARAEFELQRRSK